MSAPPRKPPRARLPRLAALLTSLRCLRRRGSPKDGPARRCAPARAATFEPFAHSVREDAEPAAPFGPTQPQPHTSPTSCGARLRLRSSSLARHRRGTRPRQRAPTTRPGARAERREADRREASVCATGSGATRERQRGQATRGRAGLPSAGWDQKGPAVTGAVRRLLGRASSPGARPLPDEASNAA